MLDWLTDKFKKAGKDGGHPLGSPAAVREFLSGVPTGNPIPCLRTLDEQLESAHTLAQTLSPAAYRYAIGALDNHAQEPLRKVWFELFPKTGGVADDRWALLFTHYGHILEAYRLALSLYPAKGDLPATERKEQALFTLRTMKVEAARHKLNRLRYKMPDEAFWQALDDLYKQARSRNLLTLAARAYNDDERDSSVQAEYLRILMFETAPLENLSPEQMECLDRFLGTAQDKMVWRDAASERTLFYFTPGSGRGPMRSDPSRPSPVPSIHFGPWGAYADVTQALAALEKGDTPTWLEDASGDRVSHLALVRALHFAWSANPPKRRFRREDAAGTLLVVHDFVQVRRMVAASAFVRSGRRIKIADNFEFRARMQEEYFGSVLAEEKNKEPVADLPMELTPEETLEKLELAGDKDLMERWTVADRSAQGIGGIVPHQKKWLKVGTLLGYRMPEELDWRVAVLRRLGRTPNGRRMAGMELLPGLPFPVNVKAIDPEKALPPITAYALADFRDGILLPGSEPTLLLDSAEIDLDACLLLVGVSLRQVIKINAIVDRLPGATHVNYVVANDLS